MCKKRKINRNKINTPLLIPSISSVILLSNTFHNAIPFQNILSILLRNNSRSYLVSIFDLYNEFINAENLHSSEIIFLDSGNYEKEFYNNITKKPKWTFNKYEHFLKSFKPVTPTVLVNYDRKVNIIKQINDASKLFNEYPSYISDFLYKPNKNATFINVHSLIDNISLIEEFDILGITESELGPTLQKKCENLLQIRLALSSENIFIPIHIFGCLDVLSIILYFFCGADIFDGLSWLRYGFYNDHSINMSNYMILESLWNEDIINIHEQTSFKNLTTLKNLEKSMIKFTNTYNYQDLKLKKSTLTQLKLLINDAGIDIMI